MTLIFIGTDQFDYRFGFVIGAVVALVLIAHPSADVGSVGVGLGLSSALFGTFALFEIKRISKTEGPGAILSIIGLIYQMTLANALRLVAVSTVSLTMLVAVAIGYGIDVAFQGTHMAISAVSGTILPALCIADYTCQA